MIYHELLYSRSLTKDYRWMILPPKVSWESLKVLNQLYNLYDKHKGTFSKSCIQPLYCFNHPEATFLVSCGLSDHKDKDGRNIYSLQGISVSNKYKRHFWFILPWILDNFDSEHLLNTWRKLDFSSADEVVRHLSGEYPLKIDQLTESLAELAKTQKFVPENIPVNRQTFISYDKEGLKDLSHLISSTYHDCMDFAFGATSEMIRAFNFKIIASVGSRSNIKRDTQTSTATYTHSYPSEGQGEVANEPIYDIDRFDPRKKRDDLNNKIKRLDNKNKPLRKNNSPHMLGQFLPRILSLFEIGKKIKQRFKG